MSVTHEQPVRSGWQSGRRHGRRLAAVVAIVFGLSAPAGIAALAQPLVTQTAIVVDAPDDRPAILDAILQVLAEPAAGATGVEVMSDAQGLRTVIQYRKGEAAYAITLCGVLLLAEECLGTGDIETLVLVISAADGPMLPAREHTIAAARFGLSNIVVFLDTTGVDDAELIRLIEAEIGIMLMTGDFPSASTRIIQGPLSAREGVRFTEPLLVPMRELLAATEAGLN